MRKGGPGEVLKERDKALSTSDLRMYDEGFSVKEVAEQVGYSRWSLYSVSGDTELSCRVAMQSKLVFGCIRMRRDIWKKTQDFRTLKEGNNGPIS